MRKICYVTTLSLTIKSFFIPQLIYLSENGYEVVVICSPDKALQKDLGEKIRFIPVPIARGISPTTLIGTILMLKRVFAKEKFDMVQYSTPNASFCASIAAKLAKIRIRNYHLMGLRYIGMSGIYRKLFKIIEKLTCRLSTHIECITKSNLNLSVEEKLFSPEKATIVWNGSTGGVDLNRFDVAKREEWRKEIRQSLGYSDNDFVFGFIGRITKDKGINELLEAFLSISNRAKLLVVGQAEGIDTLNEELFEKAKENENIMFHDAVRDVEKYYAAIDVLVLPSYREGFGNVVIEAGAVGTPAIVSNIPGPIDAILDNQTALTVKVNDAQDLRDKMEIFLDTPEVCAQMGKSCVDFVAQAFDSRILCDKILERKESLIG